MSNDPSMPDSHPIASDGVSHKALSIVLIIAVLIAVATVGLLIWKTPAPIAKIWSAITLPDELRGAEFIGVSANSYQVKGWEYISHTRTVPVAMQKPLQEIAARVHILAPVISPGGTKAAFIQLSFSTSTPPIQQIMVIGGGKEQNVGEGFAPFFVDESHLGRLTTQGMHLETLSTNSFSDVLVLAHTFDASDRVVVSKDGKYVAFKEGPQRVSVYRLFYDRAQFVTAFVGSSSSYALSDDTLYLLQNTPQGTVVSRLALDGKTKEKVIHIFPASLGIIAIKL
jgi:hypothetical protein